MLSFFEPIKSVISNIAAVYDKVASAFRGDKSEAASGNSLGHIPSLSPIVAQYIITDPNYKAKIQAGVTATKGLPI